MWTNSFYNNSNCQFYCVGFRSIAGPVLASLVLAYGYPNVKPTAALGLVRRTTLWSGFCPGAIPRRGARAQGRSVSSTGLGYLTAPALTRGTEDERKDADVAGPPESPHFTSLEIPLKPGRTYLLDAR